MESNEIFQDEIVNVYNSLRDAEVSIASMIDKLTLNVACAKSTPMWDTITSKSTATLWSNGYGAKGKERVETPSPVFVVPAGPVSSSATGTMFTTAPTIPHASTCEGSCLPSSPSTSTTTLTCASPRRRSSSF